MRYSVSNVRRETYSCNHIYWKKRKVSDDNLIVHLKDLEKEEQTKPKADRKKEIIKVRMEINKIDNKEAIEKINKTESWLFEKINKMTNL